MHSAVTDDIDVVVCAHEVVYEDGSMRKRASGSSGIISGHDAMLALMRDQMTPFAWDKIFRPSSVQGLEFPLINRTEDAGYAIPAYKSARKVRVIDDSLHLYTVNPQSITWGSVPPLSEMYRFIDYLKESTHTHEGSLEEQEAFAASWALTILNGAQSALRLSPKDLDTYLGECRKALSTKVISYTWKSRPIFGAAATLLKISPALYKILYGAYIKRAYGL